MGVGFTVHFAWSKDNPGMFDWPGCSLSPAFIHVQAFVLFYFLGYTYFKIEILEVGKGQ